MWFSRTSPISERTEINVIKKLPERLPSENKDNFILTYMFQIELMIFKELGRFSNEQYYEILNCQNIMKDMYFTPRMGNIMDNIRCDTVITTKEDKEALISILAVMQKIENIITKARRNN